MSCVSVQLVGFFFFNDTATTEIYTLSLHDALPIFAPAAVVVGAVTMGPRSSIWYGAVARADAEVIEIGEGSNIQDVCTLHSDPGFPLVVGRGVTVGHRVVLHGARIDDDVQIGRAHV